jgi:Cys-rich protein (TIGR01571 family)
MFRILLVFFAASIIIEAQDISPELEECSSKECQSVLMDNSNDMYLIQKKMEVGIEAGLHSLDASEEEEEEDEGEDPVDPIGPLTRMKMAHQKLRRAAVSMLARNGIQHAMSLEEDKADSAESELADPVETTKGDTKEDKGEGKEGEGHGEDETSEIAANETDLWDWTWQPLPWSSEGWVQNRSVGANMFHDWDVYTVTHIYTWIIWVILALLVWHCCFPGDPEIMRVEDAAHAFNTYHFDCMANPRICFCSFCCTGVQWADSMHFAGFMKAWIALPVFFLAALLNGLVYGFVTYGFFTSILIIHYRQHLRKKLGLKAYTCSNCLLDICFVCWCPCCAVSQEAQVLRLAYNEQRRGRPSYVQRSPVPSQERIVYTSGRIPSQDRIIYAGSQPRVQTSSVPAVQSAVYTNSQRSLSPTRSTRSMSPTQSGSSPFVTTIRR